MHTIYLTRTVRIEASRSRTRTYADTIRFVNRHTPALPMLRKGMEKAE